MDIPRFDQGKVIAVGDVMLDRYWSGPTSRISPEAPVPVVRVEQLDDRPGGAANVALNIAALGGASQVLGIVGDDEPAHELNARLQAGGVQTAFVVSEIHPTITKLRVISRNQQLIRLDFEDAFVRDHSQQLVTRLEKEIASAQVLLLSDYAKGVLQDCQQFIELGRKHNVPVLVDPKGIDFARYKGATLLTPNLSEFEAVVGPCATEAELVTKGLALIEQLELQALLVTRSEEGMTLLQPGKEPFHLPAKAKEVYDVTGAGDTVIAVLAASMAAGGSLEEAAMLANLAASIVVGKLGTVVISGAELRRAAQHEVGSARGVLNREQLATVIADAKSHGEKVIFTNGCFDILHAGHVSYLAEAKALGDRLVVAVNDDASVTRLKGEGRPVNAVERRMAVLAGLESVDWVVSFHEDTPEALLEELQPNLLVKGGDYTVEQVVGGDIVKAHGGEVAVLSEVESLSTTAIVNKIRG